MGRTHGHSTAAHPRAFLAATTQTHSLTLVTRNVADFAALPVTVENPFNAPSER